MPHTFVEICCTNFASILKVYFLESLTTSQFKKLTEFYDASPKLKHDIKVKNPKTNIESEVSLEGLNNFF